MSLLFYKRDKNGIYRPLDEWKPLESTPQIEITVTPWPEDWPKQDFSIPQPKDLFKMEYQDDSVE